MESIVGRLRRWRARITGTPYFPPLSERPPRSPIKSDPVTAEEEPAPPPAPVPDYPPLHVRQARRVVATTQVVTRGVVVVRRGARRERWRPWMLFTRRGADMTIWDWLDEKRAATIEWPLTWKLGMVLPGLLAGWLFWLKMGPTWNVRHCMFVGGLITMFLPFFIPNFIELVILILIFGLIWGAVYLGFKDTGGPQRFLSGVIMLLELVWSWIVGLWHFAFG